MTTLDDLITRLTRVRDYLNQRGDDGGGAEVLVWNEGPDMVPVLRVNWSCWSREHRLPWVVLEDERHAHGDSGDWASLPDLQDVEIIRPGGRHA